MGEGAATLQVGIMTGKPLFNSRIGALLGVQVGAYNIGVGAGGTDPLHPEREMSNLERGSRIVGGTLGVASAPFSAGGRALSNDALAFPNTARNTVGNLDDIFRNPPSIRPQGELVTREGIRLRVPTGKTAIERFNEPLEMRASEANADHIIEGRRPPYADGTVARDIVLQKETVFVRVHGEGLPNGKWLMRRKDIEGLTALQIKDKFALPSLPKYVSEVYAPAGTRVRVGTVATQKGWGKGLGTQYELLNEIPLKSFRNTKKLR